MRAVVISGASRGLGAACVDLALDRGARVLALARSFPPVPRASHDGRLVRMRTDLTQTGELPSADDLLGFLAGADEVLLLNNAATIEPIGAVGTLTAQALASAVAVNLTGAAQLTDAFMAAVRRRPDLSRVRILYVSSSSAHRPKQGTAAYCATKAGGEMFFAVLRDELAHDPRYLVDVIDPGGMDTDMHATLRERQGVHFPDQERLRRVAAEGRLATPESVARRILDVHLPSVAQSATAGGSTSSTSTPPASFGWTKLILDPAVPRRGDS